MWGPTHPLEQNSEHNVSEKEHGQRALIHSQSRRSEGLIYLLEKEGSQKNWLPLTFDTCLLLENIGTRKSSRFSSLSYTR
jgi:hypothetical protein